MERNKHLRTLTELIQTLVKNSDIHDQHKHKKGLQIII